MIIDNEKKFIFVAVAKTGSTSITRRFNILEDPSPEFYHMHLRNILTKYPGTKNYFKFCFVRNPYDRLVSLYYDLRSSPGHLKWSYPITKYKNFNEFVQNLEKSPCFNFIHLRPQFEYISINNEVKMDFVGKFENLKDHFKSVEKKLNINHVEIQHFRKREFKSKGVAVFFKKIFCGQKKYNYLEEYTKETKNICYELYKEDFKSFSYDK